MKQKRLLVTGCPRSGTKSTSKMLAKCGIDAPHEQIGLDGTVSCYFFSSLAKTTPVSMLHSHKDGELYKDFKFNTIVHLVRNPLLCIASAVKIVSKPHQMWLVDLGIIPKYEETTKLKRMMQMWYYQNLKIEKIASMRVKIEEGEKGIKRIVRKIGGDIPRNLELIHTHKASGYNKPDILSWKDLEDEDPILAYEIKKMARRYKYNA